jgi:hypothetical protein
VTWLAALALVAGMAILVVLGTIGYLLRADRSVKPKPTHPSHVCERCRFPVLNDHCSCRNVLPPELNAHKHGPYIDRWPVIPGQGGESDE